MGTWLFAIVDQNRILHYPLTLTFALQKYNYLYDPTLLHALALQFGRPKLLVIPEIVKVRSISFFVFLKELNDIYKTKVTTKYKEKQKKQKNKHIPDYWLWVDDVSTWLTANYKQIYVLEEYVVNVPEIVPIHTISHQYQCLLHMIQNMP